jgi:hypothetical protein
MIDPIHSLAFSIQANPGVYALLLGSGISQGAKMPTGWDITLDLVRQVARLNGEDCGSSPEDWYKQRFGTEPNYSGLLDAAARTQTERQQLLRRYFEPNEQELTEGLKQPTASHRAIAWLVSQGFVRVIITTNFDHLMEAALGEIGIAPTVISTPDQETGALPLIHTKCCLFKVHGDYLDSRIRNTAEELSNYPAEFNSLLDRIFDEFGLIVCGWSAKWDQALKVAILRAKSRRFSTYWAARSAPTDAADQLIKHRGAYLLKIADANAFSANCLS